MTLPIKSDEGVMLLQQNRRELFIEVEAFTARLNADPDPKWLQKTPDGKASYIPVGILEIQLNIDFAGLVQFELLTERRELNEFIVTARIKVFHPVLCVWLNYDGIGASLITQNKVLIPNADPNAKAEYRSAHLSEFNETKQKNALEMNAPKAYAEAIKNAAKKIGKKYGAALNRKFEDQYEPSHTLQQTLEEVLPMLKNATTVDELSILWDTYTDLHTSNKFKVHFTTRRKQIESLKTAK